VEKDLASFANTAMSRTLKKSRRLRWSPLYDESMIVLDEA